MRNVLVFVVALAVVAAVFWWTRSTGEPPRPAAPVTTTASGSAPAPAPNAASPTATAPAQPAQPVAPIDRVRRLDPAARARLREQIAAARRTHEAAGSEVEIQQLRLEDVSQVLQQKFTEALPLLADCYTTHTGADKALAQLTLTSEPDLGTVIDTDAIKDEAGQPLAPALDTCLRDAIEALALPPLGDKPGKLPLQYTFKLTP